MLSIKNVIDFDTLSSKLLTICFLVICNVQAQNYENNSTDSPICFPLFHSDFIRVSSSFGYRFHPIKKKYLYHKGIDLVAEMGSPVYATSKGIIVKSGVTKGYGNYIIIKHEHGFKTLYGHLSLRTVKAGNLVSKGQLIGFIGDSGNTTGVHLHYEAWFNNRQIDPMKLWQHLLI